MITHSKVKTIKGIKESKFWIAEYNQRRLISKKEYFVTSHSIKISISFVRNKSKMGGEYVEYNWWKCLKEESPYVRITTAVKNYKQVYCMLLGFPNREAYK